MQNLISSGGWTFSLPGQKKVILQTNWLPNSAMQLYTDAPRLHSWGAYWSGRWLQSHWSPKQRSMNIAWKELFAILVTVQTWGTHWARKKILFHCDNRSVVFSDGQILSTCSGSTTNSGPHPCQANRVIHQRLLECCYYGIATSTRHTYQSGITSFHHFCSQYNISPLPTASLTLQYFLC